MRLYRPCERAHERACLEEALDCHILIVVAIMKADFSGIVDVRCNWMKGMRHMSHYD